MEIVTIDIVVKMTIEVLPFFATLLFGCELHESTEWSGLQLRRFHQLLPNSYSKNTSVYTCRG